ncbi:8704_t:CDS:2, partial [Dentiscutata erythropus]
MSREYQYCIIPFSGHHTLNEDYGKEFLDNKKEYDCKKDDISVKEKKRNPLALLPSNTELNIHKPKKKHKISKPPHD